MLFIKGTPTMMVTASPNRIGQTQKPDTPMPDAIALSSINAVVPADGSAAK
jgi:hypothetical protein